MHIALISEHASPLAALGGVDAGGQNVYVAQTATLLNRRGHLVDVYTRRNRSDQPETVTRRPGLRVIHVEAGPAEDIPKEDLYEFMPRFADEVERRMLLEGRADLVHAHFWMSGLVALDLKRRLGIPFVITFHALGKVRRMHQGDADRFPEARFAAEREIMDEAERIVAQCPQDAHDMVELYGVAAGRLVQIPCGFDPGEMGPMDKRLARELLGVDPAARVVLQLGRMVPRKGVDDAIRGFARATRDEPEPSLLLVVGGEAGDQSVVSTPEGSRLLRIAEEEGAAERVRILGSKSRESLRWFYSAADVFVSVPWYEPFGITPLEAMACGVPVLGSRVGGVKYTVEDGMTGMLVPPRAPDAVAESLAFLLKEDRIRDRMGRAGRARVEAGFTWEHVTLALDALYSEVGGPAHATSDFFERPAFSLRQAAQTLAANVTAIEADANRAARLVADTVITGGTVLVCGNGGSASDAEHLAGELVGRYTMERPGMPAIALTSDASIVTAVGNDYGFPEIFARQVEAHARPSDLLVAISTSGKSANIIRALGAARAKGVRTVGLLGSDGGPAKALCDVAVVVPSSSTARVQEVHQLVVHHFAAAVDDAYTAMVAPTDLTYSTSLSQQEYHA